MMHRDEDERTIDEMAPDGETGGIHQLTASLTDVNRRLLCEVITMENESELHDTISFKMTKMEACALVAVLQTVAEFGLLS